MTKVLNKAERPFDMEDEGIFLVRDRDGAEPVPAYNDYSGAWQAAIRRGLKEQHIYIRLAVVQMSEETTIDPE